MNFALTEEQAMIREAAASFLAETCGSEAVRAAMALPQGFDPAVWHSIAGELGWCGLPVAEDHGGLGLGPVELMLVQEQAGYHLLPAPFFASACLATTLLNTCADAETKTALLPPLAVGELTLSAPLPSRGAPPGDAPPCRSDFSREQASDSGTAGFAAEAAPTGAAGLDHESWWHPAVSARPTGDGWSLTGQVSRLPHADAARQLLLTADLDGDLGLFLLDPTQPGVGLETLQTWDASRPFSRLALDAAQARRCDGPELAANLHTAQALVRLYLAAEQLGAAQRCLDLTVAYVQERKQFGRPVGAFQAVKHRCAQMMVGIESTRSAVYGAAALAASTPAPELLQAETAGARALATETLQFCAGEAIQLHGGVGFTWEYDPQLYFKRAQASAHWLGEPGALRAGIAAYLLDD